MPTIFFHCPKLSQEQKSKAIKELTRVGSEVTGMDERAFVVYLEEKSQDNVGVGGTKLSDRDKD